MANLLDKSNILITPTAYSDGKIHSAKPIQSLSAEKVVNGDFENGSTGWTLESGWSISEGKVSSNGTQAGFSSAYQDKTIEVGKHYQIEFTILEVISGGVRLLIDNTDITNVYYVEAGTYMANVIATGSLSKFGARCNSSFIGSIDNISVKEVIDSDLNFTRGSAGTRVNAQGLIENSQGNNIPRINYKDFQYEDSLGSDKVVNGNFATDSDWTKGSGWTISGGKAISSGNTSNLTQTLPSINANKSYTITFDLLDFDGGQFFITFGGNDNSETYQGNGTYELVINPLNAVNNIFYLRGNSFTGSIDNVSVKEVTKVVTPNSGVGSWLIEPQSTNLVEYSESLNSYLVNKVDASITENYGISPDGTLNSSRVQFNDSTAFVYSMINISTEHTSSVYIKGIANETIKFGIGANVTTGDLFTLNGDWQRIFYSASSATQLFLSTYGGSTARDLEIFGLQLEQQSFATSYIPTNGSVQTRLAETASRSGLGDLINSTEGVFYAEISALANDGTNRRISLAKDGDNKINLVLSTASNTIQSIVIVQGAVQFNDSFVISDTTQFFKVALKYKQNDFALWVNGVEVATDTSGNTFQIGELINLTFDNGNGNNKFFGNIKAVAVYPILTDQELECLTTR